MSLGNGTTPLVLSLQKPTGSVRHEHRVRQFSTDYALLTRLRTLATDLPGAAFLVDQVCRISLVPPPAVTFHGRRGPHTGYCMAPRWHVRRSFGEEAIGRWEQRKGRPWPDNGMIRLGRQPALETIAHELGHHFVNHREPPGVPAHGKVWVAAFDSAAQRIASTIDGGIL